MQGHIVLKPGVNGAITVSGSAVGLPVPAAGVMRAMLAIEGADVRMRWDGTDPTSSVGYPMAAGTHWVVTDRDLIVAMKFIRQTTDATINVAYMTGG